MNDTQLQNDVLNELEWEPSVHAAQIGVGAKDGIVTLTGTVPTYAEKLAAEKAAKRVRGVKALVEEMQVKVPTMFERSDADIARAAINALTWDVRVPDEKVKVKVENGWVNLDGQLDWAYQREAAVRAVRNLAGVLGVTNLISLKPRVGTAEFKRRLSDAFKRNAELDVNSIRVETTDGRVSLFGKVHTWQQHDEAARVAWSMPGVIAVEDHVAVTM